MLMSVENIAPARRTQVLTGIEAGRGVAAMLVVGLHAWHHCESSFDSFAFGNIFAFGHAGVDFFFVLSGFIIYHVHQNDIGWAARLPHYAQRRFTRIYPFYWIVLALTLLSGLLAGRPMPLASSLIQSLALAPTAQMIVGVAWTLQHEMLFYTIFALLIINRRLGQTALGAWLILILACSFIIGGENLKWPPLEFASYFDLEFFLGMGAAWLLRRYTVSGPRLLLLLCIVGFLAIGLAEDAHAIRGTAVLTHLGYGSAATGMVLGLVEAERQGRLVVPPVFALLGSASYAIYLTHELSIGAVWQLWLAFGLAPFVPVWLLFLGLVTAAAISGVVVSYTLEGPSIALARRSISGTAAVFVARVRTT